VVKPTQRKEVVRHWLKQGWLSERKACQVAGISRSGLRYRCKRPEQDTQLKEALLAKASQYPRYGYLMLHGLLKNEGLVVNKKRTYRLYTEAELQVRTKKRKKLHRPRVPMIVPTRTDERWSMDFLHDQLADGRRFRIFNIVDDFSRECIGQIVDSSISGNRVTRLLTELLKTRRNPKSIVCDNGTEFTSKAMFFWARDNQVKLSFIQPGKPAQNAFAESFNGKFRDSCLNQHWFRSLDEAREMIETWRRDYNEVRPHSALGYQPPAVFARKIA
jgi:putative transposase